MTPEIVILLNRLDKQDEKLLEIQEDIIKLKLRSSFWGAVSGALAVALVQFLEACF